MKTYLVLILSAVILGASPSIACPTTSVDVSGNLDPSSALSLVPVAPSSFSELASPSQFSASLDIFDRSGTPHAITLYFFHTGPHAWAIRAYVDGGQTVGTYGVPVLLGSAVANFNEAGIPVSDMELNISPQWSNGSVVTGTSLDFRRMTQVPTSSYISSMSQNGSTGGCAQRGHVDFDGDGVDDVATFNPKFGVWAILKSASSNTQFLWKPFGRNGDYPMPGDYTGDGLADLVVWRPSNGTWYICTSESNYDCSQAQSQPLGQRRDIPLNGDYDGDGVLDFAVWRPSTSTFYYYRRLTGQVIAQRWGTSRDIPLAAGVAR